MHALRCLVVGLFACAIAAPVSADDKKENPDYAKLLVGKWKVVKSEDDPPVGTVVEFTEGGKMKIAIKDSDGKEENLEATYKIDGEKLLITLKVGAGEEKKDPATIKKLSAAELVIVVQRNETVEFKRVK